MRQTWQIHFGKTVLHLNKGEFQFFKTLEVDNPATGI